MNQTDWNVMTAAEKAEYMTTTPRHITRRMALDGSAKVGDPDAVKPAYTVFVGDVQISHPSFDIDEAQAEADETVAEWVALAKKEADEQGALAP